MMPRKLTLLPKDLTNGTIGQYLTEKDQLTLAMVSKTTQSLFQPARLQKMANQLLLQVMHGEQEKAEKILKIRPELLMMTGFSDDYSGRTFETTAFRYALWALDTRYMCNMMLDCLPCNEEGEFIKQALLMQFNAQVQDGVDYELNGVITHETHFNFSPIKAALQTCVDNYPDWVENNNWDAMRNQWSNVVGLAQRYIPAHVAQHYCDPDEAFYPTPAFNKKTFNRSFAFDNYISDAREFWFGALFSISGLGVDFGITRGISSTAVASSLAGGSVGGAQQADLAALTALCELRMRDLVQLMRRLDGPSQKPDSDPDMRKHVIP